MKRLYTILWYSLVFLIPFESAQITVLGLSLRFHQITLLLLLGVGVFAYRSQIIPKLREIGSSIRTKTFWYQHIYPVLFTLLASLYLLGGLINGESISFTLIRSAGLATYLLMFWVIYYGIRSRQDILAVIKTLFLSMGALIMVGIYEAIAFQNGWEDFMYFVGRVDSIFPEPNWFAIFISIIYAILIPVVYYLPLNKIQKATLGLLWIGITLSSILTMGRASWLTIGILLVLFFSRELIFNRTLKKLFLFGGIVIVISSVSVGLSQTGITDFNLWQRFESIFTRQQVVEKEVVVETEDGKTESRKEAVRERDINVTMRYDSYQRSIERTVAHPIIGQGPMEEHNLFLGVSVTSGIVGLSVFVALLYLMFKQSLVFYSKDPFLSSISLLVIVAVSVTGIFNDSYLFAVIWLAFALVARIPDIIIDDNLDTV